MLSQKLAGEKSAHNLLLLLLKIVSSGLSENPTLSREVFRVELDVLLNEACNEKV